MATASKPTGPERLGLRLAMTFVESSSTLRRQARRIQIWANVRSELLEEGHRVDEPWPTCQAHGAVRNWAPLRYQVTIPDLHRIWLPRDGANRAPLVRKFGLSCDLLALLLSNPPSQPARAPGGLRGFCRFGLGFAPPESCQKLLRQWNESALENNIVVACFCRYRHATNEAGFRR